MSAFLGTNTPSATASAVELEELRSELMIFKDRIADFAKVNQSFVKSCEVLKRDAKEIARVCSLLNVHDLKKLEVEQSYLPLFAELVASIRANFPEFEDALLERPESDPGLARRIDQWLAEGHKADYWLAGERPQRRLHKEYAISVVQANVALAGPARFLSAEALSAAGIEAGSCAPLIDAAASVQRQLVLVRHDNADQVAAQILEPLRQLLSGCDEAIAHVAARQEAAALAASRAQVPRETLVADVREPMESLESSTASLVPTVRTIPEEILTDASRARRLLAALELLNEYSSGSRENGSGEAAREAERGMRTIVARELEAMAELDSDRLGRVLASLRSDPTLSGTYRDSIELLARELVRVRDAEREYRHQVIYELLDLDSDSSETAERRPRTLIERRADRHLEVSFAFGLSSVEFRECESLLRADNLDSGLRKALMLYVPDLFASPGRIADLSDRARNFCTALNGRLGAQGVAEKILVAGLKSGSTSGESSYLAIDDREMLSLVVDDLVECVRRSRSYRPGEFPDVEANPEAYSDVTKLDGLRARLNEARDRLVQKLSECLRDPRTVGLDDRTVKAVLSNILPTTTQAQVEQAMATASDIAGKLGVARSGRDGERGRAAINALIAGSPEVLLLDEESAAVYTHRFGRLWAHARHHLGQGGTYDILENPRSFGSSQSLRNFMETLESLPVTPTASRPAGSGVSRAANRLRGVIEELRDSGCQHPEIVIGIMLGFGRGHNVVSNHKSYDRVVGKCREWLLGKQLLPEDFENNFSEAMKYAIDSGVVFELETSGRFAYTKRSSDIKGPAAATLRKIRQWVWEGNVDSLLGAAA